MSKTPSSYSDHRSEDGLQAILDSASRFLFWGGLLATVSAIGLLLFTYSAFGGGASVSEAQALSNIGIFSKILVAGVLALGVSTAFMFWGEETLGIMQLGLAAALYFAPLYVPNIMGGAGSGNQATQAALGALQMGGQVLGGLAIVVLLADISVRIRTRAQQGSKADQLKYGKGVKEERDIQNVFMGKCWQLPYCRKFVRERCPIFHSKRTCWKERVGCMCEEEVIRNAMENKPIPKDELLSTKFIPYNNRLTEGQKAERCRSCVIYNEHQKHKYKLMLPVTIVVFTAFYLLCRPPLLDATGQIIRRLDKLVGQATLRESSGLTMKTGVFEEILLVTFMIVAFAYVMKMLEYLIFKLKV